MVDPTAVVFDNPILTAALAALLILALHYQRGLTWPEYRLLHAARRAVFPPLQRYSPAALPDRVRRVPVLGRVLTAVLTYNELVNRKGGRDDAEFLTTAAGGVKAVAGRLREAGGSLHLISSLKRRPPGYGDVFSAAHLVWTHDDGTQTEAYLFRNSDGTTDVYAHHETSVADPEGHLEDRQTDGDPRGVVREALGMDRED